MKLAVLFLDICKFSQIPSYDEADQDNVLRVLNLFMAEMLYVIRAHQGEFEKNTGDGLMAYFKGPTLEESVRMAAEAAVTMHCYNDQVISPRLKGINLPEIKFRVGIEVGLVTLAKVGVRGDHNSIVAIGNTPNIACRLMKLIPDGGIVLGNHAQFNLPREIMRSSICLVNGRTKQPSYQSPFLGT
jgi:adenylate cyclase